MVDESFLLDIRKISGITINTQKFFYSMTADVESDLESENHILTWFHGILPASINLKPSCGLFYNGIVTYPNRQPSRPDIRGKIFVSWNGRPKTPVASQSKSQLQNLIVWMSWCAVCALSWHHDWSDDPNGNEWSEETSNHSSDSTPDETPPTWPGLTRRTDSHYQIDVKLEGCCTIGGLEISLMIQKLRSWGGWTSKSTTKNGFPPNHCLQVSTASQSKSMEIEPAQPMSFFMFNPFDRSFPTSKSTSKSVTEKAWKWRWVFRNEPHNTFLIRKIFHLVIGLWPLEHSGSQTNCPWTIWHFLFGAQKIKAQFRKFN